MSKLFFLAGLVRFFGLWRLEIGYGAACVQNDQQAHAKSVKRKTARRGEIDWAQRQAFVGDRRVRWEDWWSEDCWRSGQDKTMEKNERHSSVEMMASLTWPKAFVADTLLALHSLLLSDSIRFLFLWVKQRHHLLTLKLQVSDTNVSRLF